MLHADPDCEPPSPIESSFSTCEATTRDSVISVLDHSTLYAPSRFIATCPSASQCLRRLEELQASKDASKLAKRSKAFTDSLLEFVSSSLPLHLPTSYPLHSDYGLTHRALGECIGHFLGYVRQPLDESMEEFRLEMCLEQLEMLWKTLLELVDLAFEAGALPGTPVLTKSGPSHPSSSSSPSSGRLALEMSKSSHSPQPSLPNPSSSSPRLLPSTEVSVKDVLRSRPSKSLQTLRPSPATSSPVPSAERSQLLLASERSSKDVSRPPRESTSSQTLRRSSPSAETSPPLPPPKTTTPMSVIEIVDQARRAELASECGEESAGSSEQLQSVSEESDRSSVDGPSECSSPSCNTPSRLTVHIDSSMTTLASTQTSASSVSTNSRIVRRIIQFKPSMLSFRSKSKTSPLDVSGSSGHDDLLHSDPTSSSEDEIGDERAVETANAEAQFTLQARSLQEVLDLVTGKEMTLKQGLKDVFFQTFRWYLEPVKFVQELQKRFIEYFPRMNPDQEKIAREWQVKNSSTPLRIIHLILTWLRQYWIPELDNEAFEPLQTFAKEWLTNYPDEALIWRLLQALNDVQNGVANRQTAVKDHWDLLNSGTLILSPSPTGFKVFTHTGAPVAGMLSDFDTPSGRLEFSRQLTAYLSELYAGIDADSLVWGHYKGVDTEGVRTARLISEQEKGLEEWVVASVIANFKDLAEMSHLASFWFNVLKNCNQFGNFSAVRSIVNSLVKLDEVYKWFDPVRKQHLAALNQWAAPAKQWRMLRARNSPCIHPISSVKENIDRCKNEVGRAPEYASYGRYSLLARAIDDLHHAKLSYKFNKTPHIQEWIERELKARHPIPIPPSLTT
ncbi:hypothetical protein D9758_002755 [Tetrapyrgos nigripes]|uniref:N-terminal Ras-GEF domain-containing protein n=1 Tax=Tetrapyrgos nigripes TaxID=182062 RepID=A0A8H5GQR9_9AGAR|nr:hypothetical protein D9758_002755 [Tetrapyrgos nigripes]